MGKAQITIFVLLLRLSRMTSCTNVHRNKALRAKLAGMGLCTILLVHHACDMAMHISTSSQCCSEGIQDMRNARALSLN